MASQHTIGIAPERETRQGSAVPANAPQYGQFVELDARASSYSVTTPPIAGLHMKTALLIGISLLAANFALAQTPPPSSTNPSSASSPHQRDSTTTTTKETPAADNPDPSKAYSPHQKQVTKQDKMMNDCMMKRQSETASLSKDDAKKACEAEMKKKGAQ